MGSAAFDHGCIRDQENKRADTVIDAIDTIIINSGRAPTRIWCDQGSEFVNAGFKARFNNIYHTYGEFKCSVVERFNRTLKDLMWYKMTRHDTQKWVDRLPRLLHKYNNRWHSTIRMTPTEGSDKANETYLLEYQHDKLRRIKRRKPKFQIGDVVRISKNKGIFEKGFTPRWSYDLFEIIEVLKTKPVTYRLKDLMRNETIEGSFYESEMQRSKLRCAGPEGVYLPALEITQ